MKISGLSIFDAKVGKVGHSSVAFSGSTAIVNMINIRFSATKYENKTDGCLSIDRVEAKKLIKQLNDQLKIRTRDAHIRWDKRKKTRNNDKNI